MGKNVPWKNNVTPGKPCIKTVQLSTGFLGGVTAYWPLKIPDSQASCWVVSGASQIPQEKSNGGPDLPNFHVPLQPTTHCSNYPATHVNFTSSICNRPLWSSVRT